MDRKIGFTGVGGKLLAVVILAAIAISLYGTKEPVSGSTLKLKQGETLVNPLLFGNNLMWYRDDGFGIWDPEKKEPVMEVVHLARSAGITLMRWPGGCGLHHYKWKLGIGPLPRTGVTRPEALWLKEIENRFGLDEFMKVCEAIGAESVIGISYFEDTPQSAAELVEYCNGSTETKWGKKRAENGHPEPYNVRFWEYGNETYHGDHGVTSSSVDPAEYSRKFVWTSAAMKKVDPNIKIGVVADTWSRTILRDAAPAADFLIVHTYPIKGYNKGGKPRHSARESFQAALASSLDEEKRYWNMLSATEKRLFLGITEYNIPFVYNGLPAWRLSLGEALACADLIAMMMRPENRVGLANYWEFVNAYWGQVANEVHFTEGKVGKRPQFQGKVIREPYWKRPAQYMFEMYKEHFGPIWIPTRVSSPTYDSPAILGVRSHKAIVVSPDTKELKLSIVGNSDITARGKIWIGTPWIARDGYEEKRNFFKEASSDEGVNGWSVRASPGLTVTTDSPEGISSLVISARKSTPLAFSLSRRVSLPAGRYSLSLPFRAEGLALQAKNNIPDPGFEEKELAEHWQNLNQKDKGMDIFLAEEGRSGRGMKVIFSREEDLNVYFPRLEIPVSPNTTYRFRGWMKTDLEGGDAGFSVQDARDWTYFYSDTKKLAGKKDWTLLEASFTTLSDTPKVILSLRHEGKKGRKLKLSGTVWVDDLEIVPVSPLHVRLETVDSAGTVKTKNFGVSPSAKWRTFSRGGVPVLSVNASLSADRKKVFLMIINKDLEAPHRVWIGGSKGKQQEVSEGMDSEIHLEMPLVVKEASAWVLTGPTIEADNETDANTVKTRVDTAPEILASGGVVHTLPPRSLTSLEMELK